ncbi:MAG: hypothetical protein ACUVV4_01320 [Candidatus Bathyarchaeia archaeon]
MPRDKKNLIWSNNVREEIIGFFRCVMDRKFTDAERNLISIREKLDANEFKAGYFKALEGILLSTRTGDSRDFINRMPTDLESQKRYGRDFSSFLKDGIHTPFDIGFFSAWSDFLNYQINEKTLMVRNKESV